MIAVYTVGVAVLLLTLVVAGVSRTLLWGCVLTTTVAPFPIVYLAEREGSYVVGVASPEPTITSFSVAIVAAAVFGLVIYGRPKGTMLVVPALIAGILGAVLLWPNELSIESGAIHFVTSCLAWIVGLAYSVVFSRDAPDRPTLYLLLAVALAIALPSWWQWFQGVGAEDFGDRTGGIFQHPGTTGKVAVILICIALPMTQSADPVARRVAIAVSGFAALGTLPSLSRANVIAVVGITFGWFLLNRTRFRLRTATSGGLLAIVLAAVFLPPIIDRFRADPEGNDRPELLEAALRQLPDFWLFGTGPNSFVQTISAREPIVAQTGFPVHNSIVLGVMELGALVVAALVPLAVALVSVALAFGNRRRLMKPYSDALLLLILGVVFIGLTGWGMLRQPIPELVLFACAILWANAKKELETGLGFDTPSASATHPRLDSKGTLHAGTGSD